MEIIPHTQSWDSQTLREMANRAYNYRRTLGKDEFRGLFAFIETLEIAEKKGIDISEPEKFRAFILKLKTEQERLNDNARDRFRKDHIKPTKKGNYLKMSNKDWRIHLFMEGEQVYPF